MKKDIPLTIETLTAEDDEQHRITSAKEIEFLLRGIAEKETPAALYYGEPNNFILTRILAVDGNGIWLERAINAPENQRISNDQESVFVSSHNKVKIQFATKQISKVEYQGYPAFYLPLPSNLYRLQRREYFRLMPPSSEPLRCIIPPVKHQKACSTEVTIMDISAGGVGLTCTENDTDLIPGETYSDCRIHLPDVGTISGTLEVKNLVSLTTATGHSHKRAGCEFKNLDGADIILLQRYVTNMQRSK